MLRRQKRLNICAYRGLFQSLFAGFEGIVSTLCHDMGMHI
jgi:hypothetical protein